MRKLEIAVFAVLVMFALGLAAQSITLRSPNGGERWQLGSTQTINWVSSGITAGTYKVTLWRGDENIGTIASEIPFDRHSYPWTVGELVGRPAATIGENYRIKVRLQGETPNDLSDGYFAITAAPGSRTPVIRVTAPNGGEQLGLGGETRITWTASDIPAGAQFKITLWRGGSQVGVIATDLGGSARSHPWTVGNLIDRGNADAATGYLVKVKIKGEPYADESDRTFEIKGMGITGTAFHLGRRDYEVESLTFKDYRGNPVMRINGVLEFPYTGGRTRGFAQVRVKRHPGLATVICRPRVIVALRILSSMEEPHRNSFALTFDNEGVAEVLVPFSVREGLRPDSDINIQAYLDNLDEGCDRVRTNNSKAWNLNLHPVDGAAGRDLGVEFESFRVTKVYGRVVRRWHFMVRVAVLWRGDEDLKKAKLLWRILEDGAEEVSRETLFLGRTVNMGERQFHNIERYYSSPDKPIGNLTRLKPGHRYVVEITVDPDNDVREVREDNNQASRSVTLPD